MIRLFSGIELPEDVAEQVYSLRGGVPLAKWIDKEKLHLPLRFFGNIQEDIGEHIHDALTRMRFPAFQLMLTQLGYFDTGNVPHHLWVGVDNFAILDDLAGKIDTIATNCGLPPDRFRFHAHVTIASLKGTSMNEVGQFIAGNNLFKTRPFDVNYITLFSSHAREDGSGKNYRVEARYPLDLRVQNKQN